jgi:replicative DNA helicase
VARDIACAQSKYRVYEGRLKRAEQLAAKAQDNELEDLEAQATKAAEDLASIDVPEEPQLLADDASPEKLATILSKQHGRVALMSDEGGVFDMMAGRYSQGVPNLDVYLKGHAGGDLRVDRVGRPADRVHAPALSMGVAAQPDVLRGLLSKPGFRGRGLLGRVLYSKPKDTLGFRGIKTPGVQPAVEEAYGKNVKDLLALSPDLPNPNRKPHVLRLDEEAQGEMEAFARWLEPRLAEGGELGTMTDWAGKLAGAVARIAGILHMLDHAGKKQPWTHEITKDVVERAVKVGHYLIPHAKSALAFMGSDPAVEDARYVLRWIEKTGSDTFTKRDAWQGARSRFNTVSELEPALDLLVAHGYIREDPNQPQPKGRGRKPSPRYEVNPFLQPERDTHNPQNSPNDAPEDEYVEGVL